MRIAVSGSHSLGTSTRPRLVELVGSREQRMEQLLQAIDAGAGRG